MSKQQLHSQDWFREKALAFVDGSGCRSIRARGRICRACNVLVSSGQCIQLRREQEGFPIFRSDLRGNHISSNFSEFVLDYLVT